ncbi:MAG: DNA polymerase/3'-5' exonuclease PolX [Clostridia bacterium]|nr:DNA polymerase/3'-5' exonuclease PolX [Bacillota bacterium]MBO2522203.1 DNA polymerase/3'-5' exonuclease PolX [Bacillota bacterium]
MRNLAVAQIFHEIADLLEIKGENPFKIRAYRRGAQAISLLPEDVAELVQRGELQSVDGIGKALAAKVEEWLATGRMAYHQELLAEIPRGLIDVMKVPGIGPKLAKRLYDELGVASLADLAEAVKAQRVRQVRGLGPKSEEAIGRALAQMAQVRERTPAGEALALGRALLEAVRSAPGVIRAELAGSLRRMAETVGDLDIVAAAEDSGPVMERFTSLPGVDEVLAKGETKAAVVIRGLQVDLRVVPPESFAAALHHFTGSKEHHVRLRELAQKLGYSVSEYGVRELATGRVIHPGSEEELYRLLGLPYIPPELREGRGEIEKALAGELPELLVPGDIRGDLHVHSTWSDGRSTLEEIAAAAKRLGYEYVAICDHSRSLRIAGGLSAAGLRCQKEAIARAMEAVPGVRLLRGVEVDILPGGELDLDDEILAELDVVVASVHSGLRQDREQLTRRLVRAIEHPHVDIIGHPTGRILGQRAAYEVDIDRVIEAAARHGKALEINAAPDRLDLGDVLAKRAAEAGVMLAVNTDAHDTQQLAEFMPFGVAVARRAWLDAGRVLNTKPLEQLLAWLSRER